MKFMIVGKANAETEAGVLLAAEGLYPSSQGAQISYSGGKAKVIDGPFTEAKELIAGFWLIQVKSREEAIEWAMRVPVPPGHEGVGLDVWRVFDAADVPDDSLPAEEREREETLRERLGVDQPDA
jgi:hypothetical protein